MKVILRTRIKEIIKQIKEVLINDKIKPQEPILILFLTIFRMSEVDVQDLMLDFLSWMKGSAVKADSLHIYNFG